MFKRDWTMCSNYDNHYKLNSQQREREETLTPGRISMIEMPVRPTLDIMSTGHNISDAGLLTPLAVGTIETGVTKLAMC